MPFRRQVLEGAVLKLFDFLVKFPHIEFFPIVVK